MNLSTRVLGKNVVKQLESRIATPVLSIGSDRFRLQDLSGIGCFNFSAARNLNRLLDSFVAVKSTRDLFEHVHPRELALPRLGAISFSILGAAFELKGLGGDRPLEAWVALHRDESSTREFVTFSTLKQHNVRDVKAQADERRAAKRRKAARRNQAHCLRVDRLETRQEHE
jgi:hypothetical protein